MAQSHITTNLPQLFIIGGSGRTGKLVIEEALARGHTVTAIVRKPETLESLQHPSLNIVVGDPCAANDIQKALKTLSSRQPVVIISTLGQTRTSGSPFAATTSPPRFMEASIKAVLDTISELRQSVDVRKVVVMSMFGAGDSFSNLNFMMRWIMKWSNMSQTLEDQNLVDQRVRNGHVPFVLARPAMLKGEEAGPLKFHGNIGAGAGFMPSVSPHSAAIFLLDAAVRDTWDGTTPVISN